MQPEQIWQAALGELQLQIAKPTFEAWLRNAVFLSAANNIFLIQVESTYAKDWLESRLCSTLERTLTGIARRRTGVEFVVREGTPADLKKSAQPPKSLEEFSERTDWHISVSGVYGDVRTSLIQAEKPTWMTRYFWVRWAPILGLERMAIVLALRQRGYWNPNSGELRNTVELTVPILARESKIRQRTLERILKKFHDHPDDPLHIFILEAAVYAEQEKPGGNLSKRATRWWVRMDDPLTPEDEQFARKMIGLDVETRDWQIAVWSHENFRTPLPKVRQSPKKAKPKSRSTW